MKNSRKNIRIPALLLLLPLLPLMTSCAAGSATAAYALKAREADCLTAQGEQRVTDRVKREVLMELSNGRSTEICNQSCQN